MVAGRAHGEVCFRVPGLDSGAQVSALREPVPRSRAALRKCETFVPSRADSSAAGGSGNVTAGGVSSVGGKRHRAPQRGPGAGRAFRPSGPGLSLSLGGLSTLLHLAQRALLLPAAALVIRPRPSAPRGQGYRRVPASGTARTGRTVLPQMQPMEKHRRFLEQHAGPWTDRALRGRAVGSCVSHVAGWGRQPEIKGAPTFGLLEYKRRLLLAGRRTVSQT